VASTPTRTNTASSHKHTAAPALNKDTAASETKPMFNK
jgi:hypothetical protein